MNALVTHRRPYTLVVALLLAASAALVLTSPDAASQRSTGYYAVVTALALILVVLTAAVPRLGANAAWILPFVGALAVSAGAGPSVVGTTTSKVLAWIAVVALLVLAYVALIRRVEAARERPVSRL